MPKKKNFKPFVSEDMSDQLVVQDEKQETTQPELPDEMNVDFIKEQVEKLKKSRSTTATYFRSLRTRFSGKAQLKVLKLLEEINNAVSAGIASEAVIINKEKALIQARKELLIVQQDFVEPDEELELKQLERKIELAERRFELERKLKEIERKRKSMNKDDGGKADKKDEAKDEDFDIFDDKDNT